MGEIERLKTALSRKAKADGLPAAVRAAYAAEYSAVCWEIARAAAEVLRWAYAKDPVRAGELAETFATEDHARLLGLAEQMQEPWERELAGFETVRETPWGGAVQ